MMMSDGEFLCFKVEKAAEMLIKDKKSYRRVFGQHLFNVAKALQSIEWVEDGNKAEIEQEAISTCIHPIMVFSTLIEEACKIRDELSTMLRKVKK